MGEWIEKTLGELTSYIAKGIPPKYVEEAGIETIRVLNQKCNRNYRISYSESRLHDNSVKKVPADKILRDFDVLINSTGTGTAGRVAQIWHVPEPTTLDGHMILMRPTREIDPLYYGYAIKSCHIQVESFAEGSTGQTEINKRRLLDEVVIRFPNSLSEQKAIGRMLKAIDEKIQNNEKINNNLEEQASAIYQAWFEDFTPFDGNCPAEWKQGVLSDIANVTSGKRPPMKSAEKTDIAPIPLVGAASVMGFTSESNHVDKILVTGRVGTHGVVQRFSTPCWTSDNTLVITSDLYEYTYQILQRIDYHAMNRGSTQPLITQGDMNKVAILIPDRQTLDDFEALVGQLMLQCEANLLENAKLTELRDSLLPRLMSGELDVSDIDF
jgi:type I restriction enzyme S subunit